MSLQCVTPTCIRIISKHNRVCGPIWPNALVYAMPVTPLLMSSGLHQAVTCIKSRPWGALHVALHKPTVAMQHASYC